MKRFSTFNANNLFIIFALLSISCSTYIALAFANQLPLDIHEFRQTQTALTAYWFIHDGFKLAYETPVGGGTSWSIPFEFPLYQFLVAIASKSLDVSLQLSGRLTSYVFLLLCLFPARSITKKLALPNSVFYIFSCLLFSAPIYIYWSRTFMIETTALFFSVVAVKYFIDALMDGFSLKEISLFSIFITLSILQKSTTGLPILALLSILFLFSEINLANSIRAILLCKKILLVAFFCFFIPIMIGASWVYFTDQQKLLSPLGIQLTSSALTKWNWGTVAQRMSSDFYVHVIGERIFLRNLGGPIGLSLLLIPFFYSTPPKFKRIILISFLLGIIPLFLFTNLHIVHDYYQCANIIFIIFAISTTLGTVILPKWGGKVTIVILALLVISNYVNLLHWYMPQMRQVFNTENRSFAIGEILRRELPENDQFVAFGNDWSSTFAYIAQRKSFTVPGWLHKYKEVASNPEKFVEPGRLGAVVSCGVKSPNIVDLILWSSNNRNWKVGEVSGCLIATPQKYFSNSNPQKVECRGNIDIAERNRDGLKIISFTGWTTLSGDEIAFPDSVFLAISNRDKDTIYLETLKVPTILAAKSLNISNNIDTGFSRIIPSNTFTPGEYYVDIAQLKDNRIEVCQFMKPLLIKD